VIIVVAAGMLAVGLGGMAATGAAAAVPTTGRASAALTLSSDPVLFDVRAVSRSDAWAVGRQSSSGVFKTLILHWNGTAWSKINSPTPNPHDLNFLAEVSARSGSDAWAVGNYWNTSGLSRSLILHWNGTAWSRIKSPNPGSLTNHLFGVSARSGSDAWAVGDHDTAVSTTKSLILHWNGTALANALAG
jgi:hypothetical protein